MKKTLLLLLALFTSLLLFGCNGKDQKVELPNLINSNKVQVLEKMENLGLEVNLLDEVNNKVQEGLFSSFRNNLKVGDEVEKDLKNLIAGIYYKAQTVDLPATLREAIIAWTSSNDDHFNAATGEVVLPAADFVEVTLTAVVATGTFVLNDVTETKVANITIKYVDYDSVVYATVDFEGTTGLGTSYASGTFNANEGISISYGGSRDEGDYAIDGKGIMLRKASDSFIEITVPNGFVSLEFDYRKAFTGGTERKLVISINGEAVHTTPGFGSGSGEQTEVHKLNFAGDYEGNTVIRISVTGDSMQTTIGNLKIGTFPTP